MFTIVMLGALILLLPGEVGNPLFDFVGKIKNEIYKAHYDKKYAAVERINNKDDLLGMWGWIENKNGHSYIAEIDEDTITVYLENETNRDVPYWTGTFDYNFNIKENKKIISKNHSYISNDIEYMAHEDYKEFTFDAKQGTIKFHSEYMDYYDDVELYKLKGYTIATIKMPNHDKRRSGFDEKTNNKINISGIEFQFPFYFDIKEETSINDNNIFKGLPEKEKNMQSNNNDFVVYYPSSTLGQAELFFGSYYEEQLKINNINDFTSYIKEKSAKESSNDFILLSTTVTESSNMYIVVKIYISNLADYHSIPWNTNSITRGYGISYESWYYIKNKNNIITVATAYCYDDIYYYDYIVDYKKMINKMIYSSEHN